MLSARRKPINRLTLFTFLWASQALVHQEFFPRWLHDGSPLGWALTLFALAALLWPGSSLLFIAMLALSVLYNVSLWPFVVNHILLETLVNVAILAAFLQTFLARHAGVGRDAREEVFDRIAPVVRISLIAVYYLAFLAKLNTDFLNLETSCVTMLFSDLVHRFPLVPEAPWARQIALWTTLLAEAALPLLLTFRRTWRVGLLLGLAFHFVLGTIGHRTFSALAYAAFGLFCMGEVRDWIRRHLDSIRAGLDGERIRLVLGVVRLGILSAIFLVIGSDVASGGSGGFRPVWAAWILWSLGVAGVYILALFSAREAGETPDPPLPLARPGILWLLPLLTLLNGLSPYLGLKTQTSFTMYSNLRTETANNHLFMPALRLAGFQDDLVTVLDTSLTALRPYIDDGMELTYFEFRRIVSAATGDFFVKYRRDGREQTFEMSGGSSSDPALRAHPAVLGKILYFRPVETGSRTHCRH